MTARDDLEGALREFAALVLRAGYDSAAVERVRRVRRLVRPGATAALADASPALTTLTELLAVGRGAPVRAVEQAVAPLTLEPLLEAGLFELRGSEVTSPYRAVPLDGLLILGDELHDVQGDFVAAVYEPSLLVARLTPRAARRSMLDLGSGSGVQALLAARHCDRVVAVDVNRRALALGRLNARLNGVSNVEWREGSWLEPVGSERFDLIVCNPPYVISPDSEFAYRDSGMAPGELVGRLCREIPAHLEDGGLAIVLGMWPHAVAEDWDRVPRRWLRESGCDGVVVCVNSGDPLTQAASWNSPPARSLEPERYHATVERWQRFYEDNGIGAVSFGAVVLRRHAGADPWSLIVRASSPPGRHAARQLERLIAGNDALRDGTDPLSRSYEIPEGLGISQRFERRDGRWVGRAAIAGVPDELGVTAAVDPDALDALFRGVDVADGTVDRKVLETAVRALLRHGLLEIR